MWQAEHVHQFFILSPFRATRARAADVKDAVYAFDPNARRRPPISRLIAVPPERSPFRARDRHDCSRGLQPRRPNACSAKQEGIRLPDDSKVIIEITTYNGSRKGPAGSFPAPLGMDARTGSCPHNRRPRSHEHHGCGWPSVPSWLTRAYPGNAAHGDQFIQVLRLFALGYILTIVTSLPIIVTCHEWLAAPVKAHS
ncbi:Uncharacterised protein [Mycobacteroides abscessus subsp. abscessus]|nr:Uncharacterised protein [Mycobacteroides abscessus subsp. abscessus]